MATIFENVYRVLSRLKPTQAEFQSGWATLDVTYSLQEKNRILIEIDGKELERSEPLHPHDLQLIGELIQIYNYVEFNLRRCIELFTHAGMIVKTDKTPPLVHLSSVAMKGISQTEDGEIWAEHFAEIELHRDVRNQLAHWAARHISGESALLILSMNPAESKKRIKQPALHEHSTFGVMLVKDLEWLVRHVAQYEIMLAEATSSWHKRYSANSPQEMRLSKFDVC